jgi:hypothetical protein
VSLLRDSLCICHAFLDHDKTGLAAFDRARTQGLLTDRDVNFSIVPNLHEAEIEDLYLLDLYCDAIYHRFGVSLKKNQFNSKKKWSDRVQDCFKASGRNWDNRIETEVKTLVSELVKSTPDKALNEHITPIEGLIDTLVTRLKERESAQQLDTLSDDGNVVE